MDDDPVIPNDTEMPADTETLDDTALAAKCALAPEPGSGSLPVAGTAPEGGAVVEEPTAEAFDPLGTEAAGVGPWSGEWPPADLVGTHYDPDLLRDGDRRNVADQYRYWTVAAIVADLDQRRAGLHVAIENFAHDFNIGSVVRTSNAVNAGGVHVVGRRRWNRRGAMVTDRYLHVHHHENAAALAAWCAEQDVPLIGIDNVPGSVALETFELPERMVMLFGQEGGGLTAEALDACSAVLSIFQDGSTRSINVGAAAAIALHAWVRRWRFGQVPG